MTIACGMKFRNGIMLFADTEYSTYEMKIAGSKLFPIELPWGNAVFSFAGAVSLSKSVISKCMRTLRVSEFEDLEHAADAVERMIEAEYKKHVLDGERTQNDFSILFALFHARLSSCELYASYQTSVERFLTHRCVGVGSSMGHYLIDNNHSLDTNVESAIALAVSALARIKQFVPGCGGETEIIVLGKNGTIERVNSRFLIPQLEEHVALFDAYASSLLTSAISTNSVGFDLVLKEFTKAVIGIRSKTTRVDSVTAQLSSKNKAPNPREYACTLGAEKVTSYRLNNAESLIISSITRSALSSLEPPTGDPLPPQPSQELPGGSGES